MGGKGTATRSTLIVAVVGLASLASMAALPSALAHHYEPIQPGASFGDDQACTMAFVLRGPAGGSYVTTAGHCVDDVGEPARFGDGTPFGEVVFRMETFEGDPTDVRDLALIDVYDAFEASVSPQMRGWGGPIGTADPSPGTTTLHYGYGMLVDGSEVTRARVGHVVQETLSVAEDPPVRFQVHAQAAPIVGGDSGSPVLDASGRAVGIVNCICIGPAPDDVLGQGFYWGTSFPAVLAVLEEHGFDLELAHAPFYGPPTDTDALPGHAGRLVEHCEGAPIGPTGCVTPLNG